MKTATFLSWVPPTVALIHVAASVVDLSFFLNDNLPDDGGSTNVCYGTGGFAFLLALLNQGVSYPGAAYLSIVMHTVGTVKAYHRQDTNHYHDDILILLWGNEELTEHLVWIGLAVLVLLFCQHRRPHGDDGLPPGAILCFYFDEPTNGTKKKKSLSFLGEQLDKKYDEVESTSKKEQVWVRAGHHMESPERLVVRKEETATVYNEKRHSGSPTNTPTSSPPISPPRVMTTTSLEHPIMDEEHLSMTRLVNSVANSTTVSSMANVTDHEEQVKDSDKSFAHIQKVKDLHAALLDTDREGDDDNDANTSSLLPTIREARGLINEMLAKSSRSKEKVA